MAEEKNNLKGVTSIGEMARLVRLSRSSLYDYIRRGVFCPPVYWLANKRPYFTQEMVEQNCAIRDTGVGLNGEVVLFYEKAQTVKKTPARPKIGGLVENLMASLKSLGWPPRSTR